jgi:endonuclease I
MKNFFTSAFLLCAVLAFAQAGAPAMPYYSGFNFNQTGMPLKNALAAKITATHTNTLSYQEAENAIKIVDLDPSDASNNNVFLLYGFANNICPSGASNDNDHRKRNKESDGGGTNCEWNREHTFAKSLGNPDLGESGPGADAHHLRACDVQRNGDRGSKKFGDGGGNSGSVGANWYPGDEWKGDVARMMMYMYLRYGNRCLPKNVGVGTINSVDSNMINLFLEWNAEDPVSAVEDQRNTYLGNANNSYGQGNRNPFIDNPYLATLIWGGPAAENRWPSLATENHELAAQVSIYPNPSHGIVHIQSAVALQRAEIVSINGQIIRRYDNPAGENQTFTIEDLPHGLFFLRLDADGASVTKKILIN